MRLEHEAAVLVKVRHPHLTTLLYQGRESGRFWLVSSRPAHGVSLKDRLQTGVLSTIDAISTCLGVLAGLAEIHRNGILHTGIHPSDVICVERKRNYRAPYVPGRARIALLGIFPRRVHRAVRAGGADPRTSGGLLAGAHRPGTRLPRRGCTWAICAVRRTNRSEITTRG